MEFNPFEVVQHILRSSRTKFCSTTLSHFGSNGEISAHLKSCWVSNVHLLSQHFVFHKTARAPQVSNLSFFWGTEIQINQKASEQNMRPWYWSVHNFDFALRLDKISWHVFISGSKCFANFIFGNFYRWKICKETTANSHDFDQMTWNGFNHHICEQERERDMDAKCLQIRTVWFSADKVALPIILLSPSSLWLCRQKAGRGGRWVWRRAELEKKFTSQMDVWFMF